MSQACETPGLSSPDGRLAQLLAVELHTEVLGLMLRLTVRQTWRNTSGAPMATRLAFALTPDQCLLEMQTMRNSGPQAVCRISRYNRQLCTTSLGILQGGEQVTVEWRIGQLLLLQGGSLRLPLAAALAPPALRAARLTIELHDPLARGTAASTTHELRKVRHANGMTLHLTAAKGLERDFCLTVHGLRETGLVLASPDRFEPGGCTVLGSHSLRFGEAVPPQRVRLKLVIDHSPAMATLPPLHLHAALERLLAALQPGDQLSLSRAGATLLHDLPRLQPCTEAYLRRARSLLRHAPADTGDPDWPALLQAAIDIPDEEEEAVQDASILLITAQAIGSSQDTLRALRASGHRLHVVTLGNPARSGLWQDLAMASGGSCEIAVSAQNMAPTFDRLLQRMRSLRPVHAQLLIEGQALGGARHEHASMAEEDTLHIWGRLRAPLAQTDLTGRPQWQASLQWQALDASCVQRRTGPLPVLWEAHGDLTQVCVLREVQQMESGPERDGLIGRYGLIVPDESHMALEGTATAGSLRPPDTQAEPVRRGPSTLAQVRPETAAASPSSSVQVLRTGARQRARPVHPCHALVQQFNLQAPSYSRFRSALSATLQHCPTRSIDGLVMHLARAAGNPGRVWAALLHCLHAQEHTRLQDRALQLVQQELAGIPPDLRRDLDAALALADLGRSERQAA